MAKKNRKPSRWASQAAVQALLKYGPQESALAELQREAEGTYQTSIAQARGAGDMSIAQVDAARPQTQQIFDRASRQDEMANLFRSQIQGGPAGSPADVLAQGSKIEQAQNLTNLGGARAQALNALTDRKLAARSGVQYATENARQQFVGDLAKILRQKTAVAGEKGAFTALTAQQLQDAADERADALAIAEGRNAQSERNSIRSSGTDPDTGLPTQNAKNSAASKRDRLHGKVSATGMPLVSTDKHNESRTEIGRAENLAKTLDPNGADRHRVGGALRTGNPGNQPVYETNEDGSIKKDPKGKPIPMFNSDGTPKKTTSVPPIEDPLLLTAALDMRYDGYISRKTQKMLADGGYSIKRLGLKTYAQWRREGGTDQRDKRNKRNAIRNPGFKPLKRVG